MFPGIGYGMFMLSMYIGTYYNIILSWAFFYIFSSFSSSLPWSSCDNWWNTHGKQPLGGCCCEEFIWGESQQIFLLLKY